ncbi:MAG TPA: two-component regulator propeller domain-containing protein, partial [Candidatus Solibacter sp.]|nr:two-component regulator propeller domain-containing protein [Candidatus Solibacter sp.]
KFVAVGPSITVYSLLQDRGGTVWGGATGGLYRIEGTQARFEPFGSPAASVRALALDRTGNVWASHGTGLCRRTPAGRIDCFPLAAPGIPEDTINTLLAANDGSLWAGTFSGLLQVETSGDAPRVLHRYGAMDGLASDRIHSLYQSSAGTLWTGTSQALCELDGARFRCYAAPQGLSGRAVLAINEDREGNLWAGVDHGLARIARHGFATFTAAEGVNGISVTELLESGGEFYAVSNQTSSIVLHRYVNGVFTSVRPLYPRTMRYFGWASGQSAVRGRAGEWWVATGEGLCRFPRVTRFEDLARTPPSAVYTTRDGLPSNDIFRLYEDARGDLWITTIGFGGGPSRWERATGELHHYGAQDVPGYASAYAEDHAGNLWIGFSNDANTGKPGGLARYRDGRFEQFKESEGVPTGWIVALYTDRSGRLWAASTDGGLARCDDPAAPHPRFTVYTTGQGLSSISVRRIGEDRLGRIYAATARGLDRLDPVTSTIRHYSTADGLAAGLVSSIFQDSRGDMWFGMTMGLSRFSPEPDRAGSAPPVYITGLTVNGEPRAIADPGQGTVPSLHLDADQRQVHIEFVALGEGLRYQYMLDGTGSRWSTAGEQRSVDYAMLAPGRYRFLVRAIDPAGVVGAQSAEVAFEILPPVWRRWWFLCLCAVTMMALAYGAHRYHLGRELELERVRTRIARDLHDDLGASLTRVAILSEIVNRQAGLAHSEPGRRLAEIAETARGLVDGMSDIVWAIDPRRDDVRSLLRRIRESASETLEPLAIAWSLDAAPEIDRLPITPEQRRNVFLTVKEALHNAARHARCSRVAVRVAVERGECEVAVRDDGCGMPVPEPDGGNGLSNMRTRAAALHGALHIAPALGGGTCVTLRFPIGAHKHALAGSRRNGS